MISCFKAYTNEAAHDVVRRDFDNLPIMGTTGPRYCPSIEFKLRRFTDKKQHAIWLEPEGSNSDLIYPNGISTGMSKKSQEEFVHLIPGLENSKILKYAYVVEYEYVIPKSVLSHSLETKQIPGLFLAG